MPTYAYHCQDCGAAFEVKATLAEYDAGLKPACPECRSERARRHIGGVQFALKGAAAPAPAHAGGGCCGRHN